MKITASKLPQVEQLVVLSFYEMNMKQYVEYDEKHDPVIDH